MITVTRAENGRLVRSGEEALDGPGPMWIDLEGPTEPVLDALAGRFGLHKLAIEDCLHLDQRPKLEEYPRHHFLVLHGFTAAPSSPSELTLHEVHFFFGEGWVITVHEHPTPALAFARSRFEADPAGTFGRGIDFVIYSIADALVDSNFEILERFDEAIEDLEERIFDRPTNAQLVEMTTLKRGLVMVRRVLSPQRDVLALFARGGLPFVNERTTLFFRDVYDHLVRLHEQIEAARDLLGNARDAWLSQVANRTNDITKQLTIFATIFLPLSFITGFFGQNFEVLSRPVFFWSMLTMVALLPVALMRWFRHKRWI